MNKSPFEIRADLLKQAQDHLEKQYEANLSFVTTQFAQLVASGLEQAENINKYVPAYFNTEQIMEKAREFYNFVNNAK